MNDGPVAVDPGTRDGRPTAIRAESGESPTPRPPLWRRKPEWVLSPLVLVAVVAGWHFAVKIWNISYFVIPAPARVGTELFRGIRSGLFLEHLAFTAQTALLGFAIGIVTGVLVGGMLASWPLLERVLHPYIVAFQSFPKIAIIPVLTIWFGFGMAPKVLIAAILAFFPILVNTYSGLISVEQEELELMRSLRASRMQVFWKLRLPTALPYILAGVELALVFALLGAVTAEFIGSNRGLGYLVQLKSINLEVATIFALLLVFAVLGFGAYTLVHWLRRRLVFWQTDDINPGL